MNRGQSQAPPQQCTRCSAAYALLGGRAKSSKYPSLCNDCAKEYDAQLGRFRTALANELTFWNRPPEALGQVLEERARALKLHLRDALSASIDVSSNFLQRVLTFHVNDGHLSEQEEAQLVAFKNALGVPDQFVPGLLDQIRHYTFLRQLHKGILPTIRPSVMLPAGEITHIEVPAVFIRQLASGPRHHHGQLLVTSSRVIFTQTDVPHESSLGKVLGVNLMQNNHFDLQLAKRQGTGVYYSEQAFYAVEVLRAALAYHLRHMVLQQSNSRAIPQDVKSAVFQRDGGRCVQCGDSQYLEFDHVIPYSKGGATSVNNLQLLCRKCNLSKGSIL